MPISRLLQTGLILFLIFGLTVIASPFLSKPGRHDLTPGNRRGGIVFVHTARLAEIRDFYLNRLGCSVWLEQETCVILRFGNMLLGFCQGKQADTSGAITFFFEREQEIDEAYAEFKAIAVSAPRINPKFRIYHFYIKDPEGRAVEFQTFRHPVDWNISPTR